MKIDLAHHHKEHLKNIGVEKELAHLHVSQEEYDEVKRCWRNTLPKASPEEIERRALGTIAWRQHRPDRPGAAAAPGVEATITPPFPQPDPREFQKFATTVRRLAAVFGAMLLIWMILAIALILTPRAHAQTTNLGYVRGGTGFWDSLNNAVRVNVVAGGAGGGLAQLQVGRASDGNFVNVGYFTGQQNIPVNCVVGCSASAGFADNTAFTIGTTAGSNFFATFNDSATALTAGNSGILRATANRALHISLRNASGTEIGTSSNPVRIDPTGATIQPAKIMDAAGNARGANVNSSNQLSVSCDNGCAAGSSTPADTFSNPSTAGLQQTFPMLWNGTTWDRWYGDKTNGGFVNIKSSISIPVTGSFWQSVQPVSQSGTWSIVGATTPADAFGNPTSALSSFSLGGFWNGTNWDRMRGDTTSGLWVNVKSSTAIAVTGTFWQSVQPVSEADGANVTLGSKADAKSTATDTTAVSEISILKEISFMEQTPASRPVTNAGTFPVQVNDGAGHSQPAGDAATRGIFVKPTDGTNSQVYTAGGAAQVNCAAASNCSVNNAQINGTTVSVNTGAADGGTQRVVPATGSEMAVVGTTSTTNSVTECPIVSAASTNATSCKASGGNLYGLELYNTTTTLYYLRLYNLAAAPTCSSATGFIRSIPIVPAAAAGAAGGQIIPMTPGVGYSTGIAYCITGGSSSTDNTSAAVGIFGAIRIK